MAEDNVTFSDLGLKSVLVSTCENLKWSNPTKIQIESIPIGMEGKDIIGLAETGSGKTGAFALPILHCLLEAPQRLYALVLTPTRELAVQIKEQFEALGSAIDLKVAVIVGGMDLREHQAIILAKRPHVVIATPGRLLDHLTNTKGFNLNALKCLVLDEADRMLSMDFGEDMDQILRRLPRERQTFLFSATNTNKVQKLQRACLRDPVKVEVSNRFQTVENLKQFYLLVPLMYKEAYLTYLLSEEFTGQTVIVFCAKCQTSLELCIMLRNLQFSAIPLNGHMSQAKRLGALNKFRSRDRTILIATEVASRGLDIPHVDAVINYDLPTRGKEYIHRVGRTARAGRAGKAVSLTSQYEVELQLRIEAQLGHKLPLYPGVERDHVMALADQVSEALRLAKVDIRQQQSEGGGRKKRKFDGNDDGSDTEASIGIRNRMKKKRGMENKSGGKNIRKPAFRDKGKSRR